MTGIRKAGWHHLLAWSAVAVVGAAVATAGCGEQQAPEAREALNVALFVPTTGELSSYGELCRAGAELAWDEIDKERAKAGEVRFWLNVRDDNSDSEAASTTARQLYEVAHFLAIVGPVSDDTVTAAAAQVRDHDVSVVTPTVETASLRTDHPNVIQLCLTSSQQGALMAKFVAETLKPTAKRALVVRPDGDTEMAALTAGFKARLGSAFSVDEVDTDPANVLDRVRQSKPGVVVAAVGPDGLRDLWEALRPAGISAPIVAGPHAYARRALGTTAKAMGEVYVAAHFALDEDRPAVRRFVEAFKKANKRKLPDAGAAITYDAVMLVNRALRQAMPGVRDESGKPAFPAPKAVGEALRNGEPLADAVTGPITVSADGSVTKPLFMLKLSEKGGRFFARVDP